MTYKVIAERLDTKLILDLQLIFFLPNLMWQFCLLGSAMSVSDT